MVYSTYQDVFYKTAADTMEYVIKQGDTYIFRGIAVKAPGADYAYIDVGKICRQYLDNNLPDFRDFNDQITRLPNALQKFTLSSVQHNTIWTGADTYLDDVTEQVEEIYSFLFNWDYEGTAGNEGMPLSDPVNGHMDCRMKLIYTQYGETTVKDFYATPLLSSPVQGGTLTAKITTDYTDVSKLTVTVDNPDVVVQNHSLTGVTFVTPINTGKTDTAVAKYFYNGEEVGQTVIILAGEQGGDPDIPQTDTIAYKGNIYISGDAGSFGIDGEIARISLENYIFRSGYTLNITHSEHISGNTGGTSERYVGLYLIDSGTPAEIGEQVGIRLKQGNSITAITATVIVANSGKTVDNRYSSWFSVDVSDTSEEPFLVSDTFLKPVVDKHGETHSIDANTVYFGDYLSSSRDYYALVVGGRQVFPGGMVENGVSPLTVSTIENVGKKTYKFTSPYPMNGLFVADCGAGGHTSADNPSCSIMNGITVYKQQPYFEYGTVVYPCDSFTDNLTEVTIPITLQTFDSYPYPDPDPQGDAWDRVSYGKLRTQADCNENNRNYVKINTADGSSFDLRL